MKRFLSALFLLALTAPLFANDDGGDPAYIPDYKELVREGYGPRYSERIDYYSPGFIKAVPKPTQAYYGKGFTIYYGYQPVRVLQREEGTLYAFGYPLSYFQNLAKGSLNESNLNQYAVAVFKNGYQPGANVASSRQAYHGTAVTSVQSTTAPAPASTIAPPAALPAIGEKPSH
jgi:hypothetical protein